jgi:AMMECR1 domain-containing protein
MKIRILAAVLAVTAALLSAQHRAFTDGLYDPRLDEWKEYSRSPGSDPLKKWLITVMRGELEGRREPVPFIGRHPEFQGRFGIFVTIMKEKKVRGCFGSFYPRSGSIETVLRDYIRGALRRDPRYRPPDISEIENLRIIVTISAQPRPAGELWQVNLNETGIVITCGAGEKTVYVPAEIRSLSIIEKSASRGDCQLETFSAVTLTAQSYE